MWEWVADHLPDAPAQRQGDRLFTWREMDRRADGVAATLLAEGRTHQDKVAHYLYNCPEYLESMFGLYKAALVPVNTNYRYHDDELVYLWDNADAVAVIFHACLHRALASACARGCPGVRTWLHVADDSGLALPGMGAAVRGGVPPPRQAGSRLRRGAAATISTCCTPVGPPACRRA